LLLPVVWWSGYVMAAAASFFLNTRIGVAEKKDGSKDQTC
jgi:hypothetical protein